MTTKAEYDAGIAAALQVALADIRKDVPMIFQSQVPQDLVHQAASDMAKAAIDAAAVVRGKQT